MDIIEIGLFSGLTFVQALIIISLILIVIIALVLIVTFKVPFIFKTRGGSLFSTSKKDKDDPLKEKISMQKKDLLLIMGRVSDTIKKETEIKKVETMNLQMSFAEEKMEEVKDVFETRFLEILRSKLSSKQKENVIYNVDYKKYEIIIKTASDSIINSFRTACRANHFDEYEDSKFLSYAERKSGQFIQIISDAINNDFMNTSFVTSEEVVQDNISNTFPKAKEIFVKLFINAKKISSETSYKLLEMEFELMDFVENYLDVNVTDEEKTIFIKSLTQEKNREIKRRIKDNY